MHRRIVENASYFASTVAPATGKRKVKKPKDEKFIRRVADKLMPKGTRRREDVKKIICFITRKKYVEPYYPVR